MALEYERIKIKIHDWIISVFGLFYDFFAFISVFTPIQARLLLFGSPKFLVTVLADPEVFVTPDLYVSAAVGTGEV